MNNQVLYYVPGVESISKRKHLLFLQKNGIIVNSITSLETLKVQSLNDPIAVVLSEEENIKEILPVINDTPIIVLSKNAKNISEIMINYTEVENVIFFRTENDPIDSLVETIRLILKMENKEKVMND